MFKNNEQMVEAPAPKNEIKPISLNLLDYMNPTTLEYFIAESYSNEIPEYEKNADQITTSMTILVDIIGYLDCSNGIEASLDKIMKILKEIYGIETTEIDKLTLIFIAEGGNYQPLNYYRSMALDYIAISNRLNSTTE